jgi:hypothetical protein
MTDRGGLLDFRRPGWLQWGDDGHHRRKPRVTPTRAQRLEHFRTDVYGHVEGWLGDRMWQIVEVIGTIFDSNGVRGHIAEFGVHHGLFLFLLNVC